MALPPITPEFQELSNAIYENLVDPQRVDPITASTIEPAICDGQIPGVVYHDTDKLKKIDFSKLSNLALSDEAIVGKRTLYAHVGEFLTMLGAELTTIDNRAGSNIIFNSVAAKLYVRRSQIMNYNLSSGLVRQIADLVYGESK